MVNVRIFLIFFVLSISSLSFGQVKPIKNFNLEYEKVQYWADGSTMNLSKIDGIIFIQKDGIFYKKKIQDSLINYSWFENSRTYSNAKDILEVSTKLAFILKMKVFIPKKATAYSLNSPAKIYSTIISDGATLNMPQRHYRFMTLYNDNIQIKGLRIVVDNTGLLTNAPIAIECNGKSNINLINNYIENARVSNYSEKKIIAKNIILRNNEFVADFSNYNRTNVQNDILYFYDLVGLKIENNFFKVINVNRLIKISSSSSDGRISTKNISIMNNVIDCKTDSRKQVIDLYQHTSNVSIRNNSFKCYGFSAIIENKTTGWRSYSTDLNITGNSFISDGSILRLFGTFGSNNGKESGFQNVTFLDNNIFLDSKKSDIVSINLAHIHKVNFSNNVYKSTTVNFMRLAGLDEMISENNKFQNTKIILTKEDKVGHDTYGQKFNNIKIVNNSFNIDNGVVILKDVKDLTSLIFKNNMTAKKNIILKPVSIKNSNIKKIEIN